MRTWTFDDCTVEEIEHDYDLNALRVIKRNGNQQTIYPGDIDDLEACAARLDAGESPIGWEDGNGNTIDADSGVYEVRYEMTDRSLEGELLCDSMETAIEEVSAVITASQSIIRASIDCDDEHRIVWDQHYLAQYVSGWRVCNTDIIAYDRAAKTATVVREYIRDGLCVKITYATTAKVADILRDDPGNRGAESELRNVLSIRSNDPDYVIVEPAESKVESVKTITQSGTSLAVAITSEVRSMGLGRGDKVKITLERL